MCKIMTLKKSPVDCYDFKNAKQLMNIFIAQLRLVQSIKYCCIALKSFIIVPRCSKFLCTNDEVLFKEDIFSFELYCIWATKKFSRMIKESLQVK